MSIACVEKENVRYFFTERNFHGGMDKGNRPLFQKRGENVNEKGTLEMDIIPQKIRRKCVRKREIQFSNNNTFLHKVEIENSRECLH